MRNSGKVLLAVLVVLIAVPLMAGGKHKCEASTQECLDKMAAKYKAHGWVGIEGDNNDKGQFVIKKVIEGSPAEAAGLQKGDVLVAMNGVKLADENKDKLKKIKGGMAPGETLKYTVERNGKPKVVAVTLGEIPEDVLALWVGKHMLEHATVKVAASK
jgi:predicted metalloprotease with PDZ domain